MRHRNPLIEAAKLGRDGHHGRAAGIYQREANKERPFSEKQELWKLAKHHRERK